jgi:S1-C subfamily serine protease
MDNMGYALPSTLVKAVCDNILANGDSVMRATLGITITTTASKMMVDDDGRLSLKEEFSIVSSQTSPFRSQLHVGDVFVSARVNDGETVVFTREHQLAYVLLSVRQGDTVTFVMRNSSGGESKVVITFDKEEYFTEFD